MSGTLMGGADQWLNVLMTMELKGMALLVLCALSALALRRRSAAGRHWVWLLGMTGLLALPPIQAVGPRWVAPLPSWTAVDLSGASTPLVPRASDQGVDLTERPPREVASSGVTSPTSGTPVSVVTRGDAIPPFWKRTPVTAVLVGAWLLGTLLLLGSVVASILAAWRLGARSRPFVEGRVHELAARLARELRIRRRIQLLEGAPDAMPMSWGWLRPVVLLPSGAERWSTARLQTVLLHELSHVRRADCFTQVLAEFTVALHWMNPLAWLAARHLRLEREYACDDLVLAAGTQASEYAEELLSLARSLRLERGTALAAVAMTRPTNLAGRLHAVLDATRHRSFGRLGAAGAGVVAAALVASLAALAPASNEEVSGGPSASTLDAPGVTHVIPATLIRRLPTLRPDRTPPLHGGLPTSSSRLPQATSCGMDREGWENVSSHSDNDRRRIEWSKPGCDVEVRVEGDVEFTADFTDVARLNRDALFSIEEQDGGTRRFLEITAGSGGRPEYVYSVNRKDQAFDASARGWYQGMLLQLFRRTGYMAHERARALLQQGGVPAVLRELDSLESDYVFAAYTEELLKQADLSDAQALEVVKRARSRVESDYYLASILQAFAPKHLSSNAMVDEYVGAAEDIESDYYRSEVLKTALDRGNLSAQQVSSILKAATEIESDYYVSEILNDLAKQYPLDPALRTVYLNGVAAIESDYYRSEVLGALMARNDLSDDELAVVLRAAATIKSPTYVTNVLNQVASRDLSTDALRGAYLDVAIGIGSDYHRAEALGILLKNSTLTASQVSEVVTAAAKIDSDYYKSSVLLDVLDRYKVEGSTRKALIDAMNTIDSAYYRGQVAERILRR